MARDDTVQDSVIWPSSIKSGHVRETIEKFFRSADDPTNAGSVSFSKCFGKTGELVARGHACKGHDGESASDVVPSAVRSTGY